jgi:hypothetical protein
MLTMATKPVQRMQYPMTFKDALAALFKSLIGTLPRKLPQYEKPTELQSKKSV